MTNKIPPDAFAMYVSMGLDRSYQRVADAFNVSKRAIVAAASRENWTGRLKQIEERTREKTDERLSDDLAEMNERHHKIVRAIAGRAVRALQELPLKTGMDGVKAAALAIRLERILAQETSVRDGAVIEKVTRQEIDRLLRVDPATEGGADDDEDDDEEDW